MRLPKLLSITPEFRAQSNGVVLGLAVGWIICELLGLPEVSFFLLTIVSMGLVGICFAAYDAARASSEKPPVSLRALFWRGVSEAALGFALMLAFRALQDVP